LDAQHHKKKKKVEEEKKNNIVQFGPYTNVYISVNSQKNTFLNVLLNSNLSYSICLLSPQSNVLDTVAFPIQNLRTEMSICRNCHLFF
jgi:hypothetical protein